MAEEVLFAILEGNIPLQEVLTWIVNETCGSSVHENLTCSRGEFVLCILNYLRESTERAWQQLATFQSPMKSVKKSRISQLNKHSSPQRTGDRKNVRRVELFPTSVTPTVLKPPDQNLNTSKIDADFSNDSSCVNQTQSPAKSPSSPYGEAVGKCATKSKPNYEENPFLVPEVNNLPTSSPLSTSIAPEGSPQLTPIHKRVHNFKSTERRSPPVSANSPDHHFKTPTRSNGMCLGDFLTKGSKSQQSKKRFSLSPTGGPVSPQNSSPGDNQNSQSNKKKHRRRINPTKVSLESTPSTPQNGFPEVQPFGSASRPLPETSPFQASASVEPIGVSQSFTEERNLLRQERLKLQNQGDHTISQATAANCTVSTKTALTKTVILADPVKVTDAKQLLKLSDMYCCVLNTNLVPNLMSELYFIVSLLVIREDLNESEPESPVSNLEESVQNISLEQTDGVANKARDFSPVRIRNAPMRKTRSHQYFNSVHNCVFFATNVLSKQTSVLENLDRITLKQLMDYERIALFAPKLQKCLESLYSNCVSMTKVSQGTASNKAIVSGNVSFQSDTDNSSNFPSTQCFSNFRKQRDYFYELLRIWEANHQKPGWSFAVTLGPRVRSLLLLCSDPINLMHFARLFRLQLVSTVSGGTSLNEGSGDLQFLEELRGIDPDKLNRLRDRLVTPYKAGGPRPDPSFPGSQEFYRDFILSASHSSFMQHLQDSLISHLLELDQTSFLASDTEDSDLTVDGATRQNFLSCALTMRLLAKFLGLIVFLPYSSSETVLPQNIRETEVSVRAKVMPPLDVLRCVVEAHKTHRLIVTVPWVVTFLGMMDTVSCTLPVYQTVLQLLLRLYMDLRQGTCGSLFGKSFVLPSQTVLLLRLSLGWLFEASFIQESFFFSWCFNLDETLMLTLDARGAPCLNVSLPALDSSDVLSVSSSTVPPADILNLIDCEVLYALCPFLTELRALLASTPSECAPGGSIRHITPVSTASTLLQSTSSGKQLELKLEDSFFHGLPTSVHRTVHFVVERITSSCVKHICNVWLPGLKQKGVLLLQEKIKSCQSKDSDSEMNLPAVQSVLEKEIGVIVDQVSRDLKAKCRSGVGEFCSTKCKGALFSLLSEESLSLAVCEMCVSIASRMSEERVISWIQNHATLTIYSKDLQLEAEKALKNRERGETTTTTAKTSHIAPGASASWEHKDSAPSPFCVLQALKLMVSDLLNGQDASREDVVDILNQMEHCVTKRQDVVPAAERILALLSVDLVVSLVCHSPRMVDSALLTRMVSLWKLDALRPVEDGLARLVCPRNMLLLAQSNNPTRLVWEKLAEVVVAVLKANLVTPDLVENQCLAIMQQEWPQNILRCFAMCMNEVVRQYQKQRDVDYKFVLLLEWLAETMAQIDYFPHL